MGMAGTDLSVPFDTSEPWSLTARVRRSILGMSSGQHGGAMDDVNGSEQTGGSYIACMQVAGIAAMPRNHAASVYLVRVTCSVRNPLKWIGPQTPTWSANKNPTSGAVYYTLSTRAQ